MPRRLLRYAMLLLTLAPGALHADERRFTLGVAPELSASGFLSYLLPRFSLKTGIRVTLVQPPGAFATDGDLIADAPGQAGARAAFAGEGRTYFIVLPPAVAPDAHARRFADWLLSQIGQRTIAGFTVDGQAPFTAAADRASAADPVALTGDARKGAILSKTNCGRCHVVSRDYRMMGIGSTPSFALMRSFADWKRRFGGFYTLNPHPAFTQITGVTEPFAIDRPPPIHPLRLSLDEVDHIIAYVAGIEPADLGAPLAHQ